VEVETNGEGSRYQFSTFLVERNPPRHTQATEVLQCRVYHCAICGTTPATSRASSEKVQIPPKVEWKRLVASSKLEMTFVFSVLLAINLHWFEKNKFYLWSPFCPRPSRGSCRTPFHRSGQVHERETIAELMPSPPCPRPEPIINPSSAPTRPTHF